MTTSGAAGPHARSPGAASSTPPRWALPFAWMGALLFLYSLSYLIYAYAFRFSRVVAGDQHVRPILINVALFTIFAAHHSVFARSGAKAWLHRVVHPAVERSVYTWAASLLLIAVCSGWQFVPGAAYRIPPPWSWIGYAAQLCGILLTIKGSKLLDVLDLAGVRPVVDAQRASASRHVPLTTTGVYGFVRHPIYLGWALLVFGTPHMTATRLAFAVISTAYLALAIPWEERGLIREFGGRYESYQRSVRWRMFPGFY